MININDKYYDIIMIFSNPALIAEPTARVPGFDLRRRLWVLLNGLGQARVTVQQTTTPGAGADCYLDYILQVS